MKFYPYEKGGGVAEKVLAMLKGGNKKFVCGSLKLKPYCRGEGAQKVSTL